MSFAVKNNASILNEEIQCIIRSIANYIYISRMLNTDQEYSILINRTSNEC